ncbi:phosphate-repressible phosphate permease [Aspergillus udagawae]|uniref:Phosphate-repressible phosphate permease n=1 Tax=Aspergillus udagawae TaxID=91492 RepID=A0A8H3P2D3_9EURO|nr:phosphate-repressible phosphate permease [Aspergillus udagawae]
MLYPLSFSVSVFCTDRLVAWHYRLRRSGLVFRFAYTDEKGDTDTLGSVPEGQQSTIASPEIEPIKGDANTVEPRAQRCKRESRGKVPEGAPGSGLAALRSPQAHIRDYQACFTYGITRDVIHHQSKGLDHNHRRAPQFDNKVEHLWATA